MRKDYIYKRVIASNKLYMALLSFIMLVISFNDTHAQITALADPGNMLSYRGDDYTSYYFLVTATNTGTIWGGCSNPFSYTDNSNLGTAIVHFWGLTIGEQWVVQVKVLPGSGSYVGCDNNGITSGTYGSWPGGFQLVNYWSPTLPAVSTNTPENITADEATVECNVSGLGNGSSITNRGVCWNTSGSPTNSNSITDDGAGGGNYTSTISGLSASTEYYVRAYVQNNLGQVGYGSEYSFTTSSIDTSQTITFNSLADKTYGDADFGLFATATSELTVTFSSSNTSIATITGSQVSLVGSGPVTIYADQAGNTSYSAAPQVSQSFNVAKKTLSVTGAIVANKPYDGNFDASISGGTLAGVINSDDVSIVTPINGTFSSKDKGEGISVNPNITLAGSHTWKYSVIQPLISADITAKVLTVTGATAQDKVYNGNSVASITGGTLTGVVNSEDVTLATATTGVFSSPNVGEGVNVESSMTITGTAIGNYILTQPTLTANITPLPIQITANSGQSKNVGEQDPIFTYLITSGNLIGEDAISGDLSRVSGESVGLYPILIGALTLGSNYSISFISADFEITNITGIENTELIMIKVYPNPTSDQITIDFGSNYTTMNGYTLKITNSLSQTVYTTSINSQKTTIDLSAWNGNGIYFVHLIDAQSNTIDIKKIVLQ